MVTGASHRRCAGTWPEPSPTTSQRRTAINLVRTQSVILLAIWAISGAVLIVANPRAGLGPALLLVVAVSFGCTSSVSTSLLFTQRIVRPIVAAASTEFTSRETAPGVVARLVMMWMVNSALPSLTIALLVVFHANGWFIPRSASVVIPVVVLTTVSVALSLRALILVSRSISDPLNDVVEAMAEVEHGQIGKTVDVYEQSEIGRLQHGFNRMVAGLTERDRLRDLFGRHVGPDVARLAVEADESLSGEVRDVAMLFIDLAGSTQLAGQPHAPGGRRRPQRLLPDRRRRGRRARRPDQQVPGRRGARGVRRADHRRRCRGVGTVHGADARARTCARCPSSTSASAYRPAPCSRATSAPRTATSTR